MICSSSWVSSGSTILSKARPVATRTSTAGIRPFPSTRSSSRWLMMPRSDPASDRRTWPCWWGGKESKTRLEVPERRRPGGRPGQDGGDGVALAEDVDAEPARARLTRPVGEVGLAVAGELVGPGRRQRGVGQAFGVGRAEDVEGRLGQVTVDADEGAAPGLQVKGGGPLLSDVAAQRGPRE